MLLAVPACDTNEPPPAAVGPIVAKPEASPRQASAQEGVPGSQTVLALFEGWDVGDYVWARLGVEGRESFGALTGPTPIDLFLHSHKVKRLTVTLQTESVDIPEAGGMMSIQRITGARIGDVTAQAWWESLSPRQRADFQASLTAVLERQAP